MKDMENLMPSSALTENTLKVARCEFHKKEIFMKAFCALFAGFSLSLIVCPQFGFGLPEGHGISHFFWMIGPWACALFCGLFLFLCSTLSVALVLNKFERHYFYQKTQSFFLGIPAILWMFFMVMPETSYVSVSYSLSWLLGVMLMWFAAKTVSKRMIFANP